MSHRDRSRATWEQNIYSLTNLLHSNPICQSWVIGDLGIEETPRGFVLQHLLVLIPSSYGKRSKCFLIASYRFQLQVQYEFNTSNCMYACSNCWYSFYKPFCTNTHQIIPIALNGQKNSAQKYACIWYSFGFVKENLC